MKNITLIAFTLTILVQLYVPINMIMEQEKIISEGIAFKFQTAPIDPPDPFRGRYIFLSYKENTYDIPKLEAEDWQIGQNAYVLLQTNAEGFAQIKAVQRVAPDNNETYVRATIQSMARTEPTTLFIAYPFDRYYMEENKALKAEALYQEIRWDSTQVAYAIVKIRKGDAVLEDVMIDDHSIKELVE